MEINKKSSIILDKFYKQIITEDLILKQNIKSIMEIPKITKIVINSSSKLIVNDRKYLIPIFFGLELITGQKSKITKAKKSIATFKLRQNQIIGCKVTLRGIQKLFFFEKLIKILLPRLTDYHGLILNQTKNIIKKGSVNSRLTNLRKENTINIGIKNFLIFPELENYFEYFEYRGGFDINMQTSAKNIKDVYLLYSAYQYPICAKEKSIE